MKPGPVEGGFTLMELMMVIVIIGILAAIAYPSYMDQVMRSRRADAKTALLDIAARQERYFIDNQTYTTTLVGAAGCTGAACGLKLATNLSPDEHYQMKAEAITGGTIASGYLLTATPQGPQAKDTLCKALTYDSTGAKSATGTTSNPLKDCW